MTTVFELRGFINRLWISMAILAVVVVFGFWEIWQASAGNGDTWGYLFGLAFIGGAAWGYRMLVRDSSDAIAKLEVADDGTQVVTQWRPTGVVRFTVKGGLANWRLYTKISGRAIRQPYLFADCPGRDRPLQLELRHDVEITDELRALAPEAFAEFETNYGSAR